MPTLVLVHIGSHFPEYINDCIRQIQHSTDISIHVLISSEHRDKIVPAVEIFPLEDISLMGKSSPLKIYPLVINDRNLREIVAWILAFEMDSGNLP